MHLNEKEFSEKFSETLDQIIEAMAESPEVAPEKFFNVVCLLENLQFFGPVIFGALRVKQDPEK